ncbi:MAG: hypothetical protein AMJ59_26545 [Gammaproteobacteria bacterium SG8_31]|nr:MAG: hypothetical protein AMJ59_26545 [Gammaproteobacteria bacterium SG8_31]
MVVLAMYIISNCPADRHPLGARHYRKKPAVRNHQPKNVQEKHPTLASDDAFLPVKVDKAIQPAAIQQNSAVIQTNITVTSPITKGQCACFVRH